MLTAGAMQHAPGALHGPLLPAYPVPRAARPAGAKILLYSHDALDRIRDGRTCLAITHRSSLLRHADVVYHLVDGQIVEDASANPPRPGRVAGGLR